MFTGAASAATITVTTTADETNTDGQVSLREAIQSVNAGTNINGDVSASGSYGNNDTISVPSSSDHYAVSTGELPVSKPVLIQGGGASGTIIDAAGTSRIFHLDSGTGPSGTVEFQRVTIQGGSTTSEPGGGAVLADSGAGFLQFTDSVVTGNSVNLTVTGSSRGGGGVYSDGNTTTITGSTFSNNTATISTTSQCCHGGGGVFQDNANVVVSNSTLSGNVTTVTGNSTGSSDDGGGAIHENSGGIFVNGSTLTGNSVTVAHVSCCQGGGALYSDGASGGFGMSIANSTIGGSGGDANTATLGSAGNNLTSCCSGGGGIYNDSGNLRITGSKIIGNVTTIFSNSCCHGGGGVYQDSSSTYVTNSSISGNTATIGNATSCCNGGGGFYNDGNDGVFTNALLSGNVSEVTSGSCCHGGGAVYNDGSVLTFTNSTIGNTTPGSSDGNIAKFNSTGADQGGGGIYDDGSGVSLLGTTVSGNVAHFTAAPTASGGGGTYEFEPFGYSNSTISDNSTDVPAGTGNGGGGVYVFANGSFANATLAGNSASATAGGGVFNNGSTLQSADSIIAQNTSGGGGGNCAGTGSLSFQSLGYNLEDDSDKTCNFVGTGDIINSNPGLGSLQDNGGPTLTRRLLAGSPAIDAGNPSGCLDTFGSLLTTDQRGAPRVGRCDIGAYEASPPVNTSAPVISGGVLVGQVLTCSNGTWSGAPITGYGYQWNRDGAAIPGANGSTYTVGSADPGHQLTCTVTATNADGSASATSAPVSVPVIPTPSPGQPLQIFQVATPTVNPRGATLTVLCVGGAPGQTCTVVVRLTTKEKLKGRKIVGLTARTKRVVVGTARVKIVTGKTKKFTVRLNKLGKSLLKKFGKLPVNAAIRLIGTNGKVVATINTKFTIRKHRARR